jgi:hypothetical protein
MKITDLFERSRLKTASPEQFRTALKGRAGARLAVAFGQTQEAADLALVERIQNRFRGEYTPLILSYQGTTVIAWRDGDQWKYGYLRDDSKPVSQTWCGDWTSRERIERAVRLSLAQGGWDGLEEKSEIILHPEDQKTFRDWTKSQKAFSTRRSQEGQ